MSLNIDLYMSGWLDAVAILGQPDIIDSHFKSGEWVGGIPFWKPPTCAKQSGLWNIHVQRQQLCASILPNKGTKVLVAPFVGQELFKGSISKVAFFCPSLIILKRDGRKSIRNSPCSQIKLCKWIYRQNTVPSRKWIRKIKARKRARQRNIQHPSSEFGGISYRCFGEKIHYRFQR